MPPKLRAILTVLSVCGVIATAVIVWQGARQQAHRIELLQLENQTLAQELRLLHQQLEAERILAAARLRQLESAPAVPAAP